MQGPVTPKPLFHMLRELHFSGKSGLVALQKGGLDRRIFLNKGDIVLLSSNRPGERMGEFLFSEGYITREILDQALLESSHGGLFGQFLVTEGHLEPEDLQEALIRFQTFLLSRFLIEADWICGFTEGDPNVPPPIAYTIPFADLFLCASRLIPNTQELLRQLGGEEQRLEYSRDPRYLFQQFTLAPEEYYIVSRIQGTPSVREVLTTSAMEKEKCLRLLYALAGVGILSTRERSPAPERPTGPVISPGTLNVNIHTPGPPAQGEAFRTQEQEFHRDFILKMNKKKASGNYYDLFDVAPGATMQDIRTRYLEYSKFLHPDNVFKPYLADLKPVLVELSTLVAQAFETLSRTDGRSRHDSEMHRTMERDQQEMPRRPHPGESAAKPSPAAGKIGPQEDWASAFQALKDALQSDPNNPEILLALCRSELRNPKVIPQMTPRLAEYMQKHPAFEEGWILLAESYMARSQPSRAASCLQTILRLNPAHQRAREMLRMIEQEKPR